MRKQHEFKIKDDFLQILILCLCVLAALFIMWTFTGQWPWKGLPYNSYVLQAQSWLEGRLDLGKNYSWLELAIYKGKYFVSFPPFPSYVMFPFVAMGWNTCDGFIALTASMLGAVYAYLILRHFKIKGNRAMFFALFVTIGSNWFLTAANAWVWFIAQNMSFALSMMAIYYALKGKAGLSLSFWACAVGCRPFQALYIPVLLYIIYKKYKEDAPEDTFKDMVKKHWMCLIAPFLIAVSYMILNYARFDNPIEFGHNYLPEFSQAPNGQFNLKYFSENVGKLIRMPSIVNGVWEYPQFNGMCIFMISPIFIVYVVYTAKQFFETKQTDRVMVLMILASILIELCCIVMHKTMGGSQFGNRYPNDVLPMVFLGLSMLLPEKQGKYESLVVPLFILGLCLNIVGAVGYYNGYFG